MDKKQVTRIVPFILMLTLPLGGCETVQVHSSAQQHIINLKPGDLSRHGLAFLTPSTVTGKEEDKQIFALVFTDTLTEKRADIPFMPLPQTLNAINQAGLTEEYKEMLLDYRTTGIFKQPILKKISDATGARYIAQLKLADFLQYSRSRINIMGIRLLETKQANVRVFLQIWDAQDGSIAWEAVEELNFAYDTGTEDPVSFNLIVKKAATNLINKLP